MNRKTHTYEAGSRRFRRVLLNGMVMALTSICALALSPAANAAGKTTTNATKSTKPSVSPNAPEVLSPGDIPDNIAFVPYRPTGGGYTVTTPEGWSRKPVDKGVEFTDKFNIVRIESMTASTNPTVASVRAAVTEKYAKTKGFTLQKVTSVTRKGGTGVLATYVVDSAPNDVTGKTIPVVVERYEFHRNATSVVLTLSGAKGADNVDPWRTVSDSFSWA